MTVLIPSRKPQALRKAWLQTIYGLHVYIIGVEP